MPITIERQKSPLKVFTRYLEIHCQGKDMQQYDGEETFENQLFFDWSVLRKSTYEEIFKMLIKEQTIRNL